MSEERIDEARLERAFNAVADARANAWNLSIDEVAALAERMRLEIMLDRSMRRSRKHWYRAYADFLDDVVEERMEKDGRSSHDFHDTVLNYVRGMMDKGNEPNGS